jgi:hypothetical protein
MTEKKDTKFKPGFKPTVHRQRGVQNKITRDIKKGIVTAAVNLGRDGLGHCSWRRLGLDDWRWCWCQCCCAIQATAVDPVSRRSTLPGR